MKYAFKHWVAGKTPASAALLNLVKRISFVNQRGDLEVGAAVAQLLTCVASAGDGEGDHDYNSLCQGLVGAVAGGRKAVFKATGPDGTVRAWGDFAFRVVDRAAAQGGTPWDRSAFIRLTTEIYEFGRLQSVRAQAVESALAERRAGARDVLLLEEYGDPLGDISFTPCPRK